MPFPKEFLWGASESGFQFEMGDRERRSLDANTDWYIWVHDKENIERGIVSGDLPENGIDYWDLFKLDHRLAEELGMNAYRVGIEWSRIFPKSTREVDVDIRIGKIVEMNMDEGDLEKMDKLANKKALQRYREIVMDLRRRGFKVFICINHFTLPLWIHNPLNMRGSGGKQGPKGWVDPYTAVEFGKYAGYLAYKFGDIVDLWVTLNEPIVVAEAGFMLPEAGFPPGFSPGFRSLRMFREALKNLVSAHVAAYNMIRNFDDDVSGDCDKPAWVGIVHNLIPTKAVDESREVDAKAAEVFDRLHNRFLLQAITDGWLDLNFNGRKEGKEVYTSFSNKVDWIGINYYSYLACRGRRSILAKIFMGFEVLPKIVRGYGIACDPNTVTERGRPTSDFGWELYPEGLYDVMRSVEEFGRPIIITENGIADAKDKLRGRFLIEHLEMLEKIIDEGHDVRGYLHWALTDNYEWAHGFRMKFGLVEVDLAIKERRKRRSCKIMKSIIEKRSVTEEIRRMIEG